MEHKQQTVHLIHLETTVAFHQHPASSDVSEGVLCQRWKEMVLHSVIFMGVPTIIACKIAGLNNSNMKRKSLPNYRFPDAATKQKSQNTHWPKGNTAI